MGHVREGLDVVDDGGVRLVASHVTGLGGGGLPAHLWHGGEQAVLVGRQQPGHGGAALDDLEHGLLLAEEILVGPGDDSDRALGADPGRLHLLDRPGDNCDLLLEGSLEADERLHRADGKGGHDHALDQLVGVGPDQGPVLERARLALGAVGDDVSVGSPLPGDAGPLAARREPAAPATP